MICPTGKAEYFSREDWTGKIRLKWFEKFGCARKADGGRYRLRGRPDGAIREAKEKVQ
jgi:hypothetical protein